MQLTAPLYYKNFKCIADRCRYGCCSRWEIDIDPLTLSKYRTCDDIADTIVFDKDSAHFKLCSNGNCPHLTKDKLCNIIINHGEKFLCDICREHPRFYNNTGTAMEVGLGASCEEACRLILESEDYITTETIGEIEAEPFYCDFDTVAQRLNLYKILSNTKQPYDQRLLEIYKNYNVSPKMFTDQECQNILSSLEYIDPQNKPLFSSFTHTQNTPKDLQTYAERYLAYLIYRHTGQCESLEEFISALGFCLFCERLLIHLLLKQNTNDITSVIDNARIISEEIEYSDCNTDTIMFEFDFV